MNELFWPKRMLIFLDKKKRTLFVVLQKSKNRISWWCQQVDISFIEKNLHKKQHINVNFLDSFYENLQMSLRKSKKKSLEWILSYLPQKMEQFTSNDISRYWNIGQKSFQSCLDWVLKRQQWEWGRKVIFESVNCFFFLLYLSRLTEHWSYSTEKRKLLPCLKEHK